MRFLNLIVGLIIISNSAIASIGNVTQLKGNGVIDRKDGEKNLEIIQDIDVFSYDTVKTGKGKVGIEFIDETRVDITEHSKLIIDEFVYDPNAKTGALSLKATLGTVRYASGQIAKNSKQNVKIETPTAKIVVRGTDFAMTVDELGGSTIILLPSCDTNGFCFVGEIAVESDAGQVIMNQAFQATTVETPESRPLSPVKVDIGEDLINNLLIISKPKEIEEQEQLEDNLKVVSNALDLDFLNFEELGADLLKVEEEDATSLLAIDFLEQDFLVDILEQLNRQLALQMRSEFDKKKDKRKTGQDEFGVILIDEAPQWVWMRSDESGNNIVLRLDQENGYTINVIQGDAEIRDYNLGEGSNVINIYQNQ